MPLFRYQESGSDGGHDYESGQNSSSVGGMALGGGFDLREQDQSGYSLNTAGDYEVTNSEYTIQGWSLVYLGQASDWMTFQDSGGSGGPDGSGGTASGGYGDFEKQTDSSLDALNGGFTIVDGALSDVGLASAMQSSSYSYSSSGSDGDSPAGGGSSNDGGLEFGDDDTSYTSDGGYSDSPGLSSASGSYTLTETSHDSASQSGGASSSATQTGGVSTAESASSSTSYGYPHARHPVPRPESQPSPTTRCALARAGSLDWPLLKVGGRVSPPCKEERLT